MDQVTNLAMAQLEYYVERAEYHAQNDNSELSKFFMQQGHDLVASLNATEEEDTILYMTFHRHLSDDEGSLFLSTHWDPEFYG